MNDAMLTWCAADKDWDNFDLVLNTSSVYHAVSIGLVELVGCNGGEPEWAWRNAISGAQGRAERRCDAKASLINSLNCMVWRMPE